MSYVNISKLKTILLAFSAALIAVSMIILPEESLDASVRGLNMWWGIVFPSLFPFFVVSELLISFGVVRFMGVILEPLMRPLFRVPGVGGFAWAMGMATGFPAGAKITARLRQENQITKIEAERLVSFTNSSSPLFIFAAISVGFFHNPRLGFLLAIAHYLGNFSVGLIMRFYGRKEKQSQYRKSSKLINIREAFSQLHQTRLKNNRPIGKLLGDAVVSSINTLLMIGGFIILFSVLNKILYHLEITPLLAAMIENILLLFNLPKEFGTPLIAGIFEITLGSQLTSKIQDSTILQQAIIVSFILGFNGFSVHAQAASILAETDIKFKPFFFARIMHGFLSGLFAFVLWQPFVRHFHIDSEPTAIPVTFLGTNEWWTGILQFLLKVGPILTISSLILYLIIYKKRMDFIK
ncbi:sporulation integral membrane protein YlbJ [Bacillus niameyensis]|uniref:sporulation integral membrane protein YlbJ n=1 Tax=Bacillus niameyensis TaxID=1522308 RepID=UPI000A93D016|nr:sporulation integral membrane protein YlbJ [Bacillus niameyensis]